MAPYLSSLCKNLYASCGDCHLWADVYRPKKVPVHWSCKLEVSIPVGWCPLPYQLLNLVDITCGANDQERTSVVTSSITLVYLPVDDPLKFFKIFTLIIFSLFSHKKLFRDKTPPKVEQEKKFFFFLFFFLRKISPELTTANPPLFAEEDCP